MFERRVEEAFGLTEHLTLTDDDAGLSPAGETCEFAPQLTNELLELLVRVCTSRLGCGLSKPAGLRRELVHCLAVRLTHTAIPHYARRLTLCIPTFNDGLCRASPNPNPNSICT